jgi:hypothetical protein
VRWDGGIETGSEVTLHYDPMLAKLIVWAPDRAQAIARMHRALLELTIDGVDTSRDFHLRVMEDAEFRAGAIEIQWLERHLAALTASPAPRESVVRAAIAAVLLSDRIVVCDGRDRYAGCGPTLQRGASGSGGARGRAMIDTSATLEIASIAAGVTASVAPGVVVFVPRTAPGDVARVRLARAKRFARKLISSKRGLPRAWSRRVRTTADRCGGCQIQHLSYEAQLGAKRAIIGDALRRIGGGISIPTSNQRCAVALPAQAHCT